ncbi:MAG: hypothetical protein EXQ92_00085 [Alphaproteobacteria bacterium]|nr:hypothetical protein [Alphaproteobacteria bacterium]
MPHLNRDDFIRLLNQLGDANDADALAAAREVDRRVKASGTGWDSLLSPPPGQADDDAPAPAHPLPPGEAADDAALIDHLLAGDDLNADTREILTDLKADIAEGNFTAADRAYLRNLRDRLAKLRG